MAGTKKTMKAVVARGIGDYKSRTLFPNIKSRKFQSLPPVKGNGVKLKLAASASAMLRWHISRRHGAAKGTPPHLHWPFTPGHEFIGHVVEIGRGVSGDFKIGDRVTSEQIVPCGYCRNCMEGNYWMCTNGGLYGFKYDGGMAEYIRFQKGARNYKVPGSIPMETAVLMNLMPAASMPSTGAKSKIMTSWCFRAPAHWDWGCWNSLKWKIPNWPLSSTSRIKGWKSPNNWALTSF